MSSKINNVLDNAAGKAQNMQGESLSTFLASLTTSGIILALGIVAFIYLRLKVPEIYARRAHQIFDLKWKPARLSLQQLFSPTPDPHLKHASGFDNYLFDRYLHTIVRIFILLGLTIPPILIPLNFIDGRNELGGVRGLDRLSFSNVGLSHTDRYWAHLVLAIFVVTSVCFIVQRELQDYRRLQNSRSGFESDAYGPSSVLVISNSKEKLSMKAIQQHFRTVPGGIKAISVNRDYSSLRTKLQKRAALIERLEIAETNLIKKANCRGRTVLRKSEDARDDGNGKSTPRWAKYLDQKERPLTRLPVQPWLPSLPFLGAQVDTIYHLSAKVAQLNLEIERDQQHSHKFPETNSAFIYLNKRLPISLAALALKIRIPPTWTLKRGTTLDDTIWQNVSISWWQHCLQTTAIYLLVATLTLGFAFPVTLIGSLSQIKYLANVVSWLQWIETLPTWLVAVIQGVLPPVMLGLLTAMVPVALRLLANMQGLHSRQATENYVQVYYFTFLFVQVFLTVSLSAGITTILGELTDTIQSIPAVLAQNLPKACNYFFSYIIMHTFTTIVSTLVEVNGLINLFILSPTFDKTARHKWMRGQSLGLQKWSTFIPVLTNIACIGLIYSVIAPLILIFSVVCFGALWILYQSYPPKLTELDLRTTGLFYPTAMHQLFTGIYFMELCLAGLFFLVRDEDGKAVCTAQAAIMIVATVVTALFQYALHNHGLNWLSLSVVLKQLVNQTGSRSKGQPDQRSRRDAEEPSVKPAIPQADPDQDEVLSSARPILWIPKDNLGIADDEINRIQRTKDSIGISSSGAFLERGKLILTSPPPEEITKTSGVY